ncbi:2-amino-4-hydroxy-6-hydroxymethyldihydropteridine diphosphokinase [Megalodesulfovibrio gigas]|uniref:2-amino-4-hydroxy-6-hydroxymethyldihydropteridine pyrophosphokinase n=1 Tax=Megalodesulfovibrio gigas (strain ATCC 19364 / DSM 1382 / NCIMB 9332 / VKM B-1759) TaxID=1121448 RepID=T2GD25_MEGG1|nr:2-amino-4-hydroxy-6-hydroxymethyldihydropteridine diphosphokinase [Megalodesulfovibrio gigas]AGW14031.1 putative 2-amino-4-hydroxy-6-hydroxymethyldihydropteridine pyrophosphokinase [Megalodesulfovibrio gigas DSM 1382 = ATCC 19364]
MDAITAYVGLGANLAGPAGAPLAQLAAARAHVLALPMVQGGTFSAVYWTEPFGVPDPETQPWYANQVARLEVAADTTPQVLLEVLLQIELTLGRERGAGRPALSARPLDLDLLLFGKTFLDDPACTVPHPRMQDRAFVLVPLAELAPDLILPIRGRTGEPGGLPLRDALARLAFELQGDRIRQVSPES